MSRLTTAVAVVVLVSIAGPAFAMCNPGTPHCIGVAPGSRLDKLKKQLANPGTVGGDEIECKNSKLCGIDTGDGTSPGVLARARGHSGNFVATHPVGHRIR